MNIPELITFIVYLIFLSIIGIYFYRKTSGLDDYLLGGKKMGKWVTALSAQASDMSGWLLMGLPGALYLGGFKEIWIAIGLFIGTVINWLLVAPRLRVFTGKSNSLTLSSFFETRFRDRSGSLRIVSAIIILLFFTIYTSSGLVAAGKLFESMFAIDYNVAVILGGTVIVIYTFLGGYLAVCWTDLFQGLLMFFAIVITPIIAYNSIQPTESIITIMNIKGISTSLIPSGDYYLLGIFSAMAWGLGYFGQPHILVRFMGINSAKELPKAAAIAIVWVFISLIGAICVGLIAIAIFHDLPKGDSEKVFILMVKAIFNPWLGGILLAAILSAIMSTIDSQLLVSSSALVEDLYLKIFRKSASEKELIFAGRASVILIFLLAVILAWNPQNSILQLVAYAWGGLGAAFGPVVLASLFYRKAHRLGVLSGMIVATITIIFWKEIGWGSYIYEIVPAFILNIITIYLVTIFCKDDDQSMQEFDEMTKLL